MFWTNPAFGKGALHWDKKKLQANWKSLLRHLYCMALLANFLRKIALFQLAPQQDEPIKWSRPILLVFRTRFLRSFKTIYLRMYVNICALGVTSFDRCFSNVVQIFLPVITCSFGQNNRITFTLFGRGWGFLNILVFGPQEVLLEKLPFMFLMKMVEQIYMRLSSQFVSIFIKTKYVLTGYNTLLYADYTLALLY